MRAQLFCRDPILIASQRLLCLNEILERDDSAAATEQFDLNRGGANAFELANSQDGSQEVDWVQLRFQVPVLRANAGFRSFQKRQALRRQSMSGAQVAERIAKLRDSIGIQ